MGHAPCPQCVPGETTAAFTQQPRKSNSEDLQAQEQLSSVGSVSASEARPGWALFPLECCPGELTHFAPRGLSSQPSHPETSRGSWRQEACALERPAGERCALGSGRGAAPAWGILQLPWPTAGWPSVGSFQVSVSGSSPPQGLSPRPAWGLLAP